MPTTLFHLTLAINGVKVNNTDFIDARWIKDWQTIVVVLKEEQAGRSQLAAVPPCQRGPLDALRMGVRVMRRRRRDMNEALALGPLRYTSGLRDATACQQMCESVLPGDACISAILRMFSRLKFVFLSGSDRPWSA